MNKIAEWYAGLEAREQRMVLIGGAVLGVLVLFGGLLLPLEAAVSKAVKGAQTRREDLAWMRVNLPELRAGAAAVAPDTGEAPMVLVDRLGREAGLGAALRGTQPSNAGVRVQLEAAPFDAMVEWLKTLAERHGLEVESISVDRGAGPGLVNASVTLSQARR
jgi:general secretion pathway protein M